jgi:serine/threonine-protein phosphatase 2A regulatory subunit A
MEEDDEVLKVLAEQLGDFVECVGGAEEASCLIVPLGSLATVEETLVRDKAVESASKIIRELSTSSILNHVIPILLKLVQGDWFTARVSACALIAPTYQALMSRSGSTPSDEIASSKSLLRSWIQILAKDDTPMVRRAISNQLSSLASTLEPEFCVSDLFPLFTMLIADDNDSVRLIATSACFSMGSVAKALSTPEGASCLAQVFEIIKASTADKSWRVRNEVSKQMASYLPLFSPEQLHREVLPCVPKLLQDPEADVRCTMTESLPAVLLVLGYATYLETIHVCLVRNLSDLAPHVRSVTGSTLMIVAREAPHDVSAKILPLLLNYSLKDSSAETKLKVLDNVPSLLESIKKSDLVFIKTQFIPALIQLGSDPMWRVRERIIQTLPFISSIIGVEPFEQTCLALYLSSYQDQVNAVRSAATSNVLQLTNILGLEWTLQKLLPKLIELFKRDKNSYLLRITVLYAFRSLIVVEPSLIEKKLPTIPDVLVNFVLDSFQDPVPNVRSVAVQILRDAARDKVIPEGLLVTVKAQLAKIVESEKDWDTKFFATKALSFIETGN